MTTARRRRAGDRGLDGHRRSAAGRLRPRRAIVRGLHQHLVDLGGPLAVRGDDQAAGGQRLGVVGAEQGAAVGRDGVPAPGQADAQGQPLIRGQGRQRPLGQLLSRARLQVPHQRDPLLGQDEGVGPPVGGAIEDLGLARPCEAQPQAGFQVLPGAGAGGEIAGRDAQHAVADNDLGRVLPAGHLGVVERFVHGRRLGGGRRGQQPQAQQAGQGHQPQPPGPPAPLVVLHRLPRFLR
ncbi:MAG: hypothetical protein P8129_22265 [Anaerolineae bacterium]